MHDFMEKKVIGAQANILGNVCDVEFDEKTMQLTKFCVKLNENVIEEMGLKKPRLIGDVRVDIPVTEIKAIQDVITLNRSAKELGPFVEKRRNNK